MKFNHDVYFDSVRASLFGNKLTQQQVDGQEGILVAWETLVPDYADLRWLAYMLATTLHETASAMWPIEEYGKGEGAEYGKPAGPYGKIYYGRGFVQLTWWENYVRADQEMGWTGEASCEKYPEKQLTPDYAAPTMYVGMTEGWFRKSSDGKPQTLSRYFNNTTEDPYTAREIINGDKAKVPSWSNGVSIGNLIKGYYEKFFVALENSALPEPAPPEETKVVVMRVTVPAGVRVDVTVDEA